MIQPCTDDARGWLGDGEVLLHIGVHKTGTTAVQAALAAARPRLREQGVRYPGDGVAHFVAANALLGKRRGIGWQQPMPKPNRRPWNQLINEVRGAPSERVVISAESFCEATPEQIRTVITEFGDRPIRVIATLRPLESLLPSNWQQYVKAGHTFSFDEWLRTMMSDPIEPKQPTPSFWMRNDHPAVLQRWIDAVGVDRVAALVVDPSERSMLFETFEDVLGTARGTLTDDATGMSNRGLSAEEVEFVRQFNITLDRSGDFRHYHQLVRLGGLTAMVEQRQPGPLEHRITVPSWAVDQARAIGQRHVEQIRGLGIKVFGDLDDLVPTSPIDDAESSPADSIPIDAAVKILAGTFERSIARIERVEETARIRATPRPPTGIRAFVPPVAVALARSLRKRTRSRRRRG
jgi:hypothetical protein